MTELQIGSLAEWVGGLEFACAAVRCGRFVEASGRGALYSLCVVHAVVGASCYAGSGWGVAKRLFLQMFSLLSYVQRALLTNCMRTDFALHIIFELLQGS